MVHGQLTIVVAACLISTSNPQSIVHASFHAQIGQQHLQTQPVRSETKKQLSWQQKLLFKIKNERVARLWISDELRKGEQNIIGECVINLNHIKSQKIPLFLYWREKQTAIIEIELHLDTQGNNYINPQHKPQTHMVRFLVKNAILTKDTQLFGSMKPYVSVRIGNTTHQTLDSKGKDPVWEHEMTFENVNRNDLVHFTILDKELIGKDDVVGTVQCVAESLRVERHYSLDIMSEGHVVGNLRLEVKHLIE